MSDELNLEKGLLKNDELLDVEGHVKRAATDEPTEDKDEDEVEAHVRKSQSRHI